MTKTPFHSNGNSAGPVAPSPPGANLSGRDILADAQRRMTPEDIAAHALVLAEYVEQQTVQIVQSTVPAMIDRAAPAAVAKAHRDRKI
jgi:hypothetical protein